LIQENQQVPTQIKTRDVEVRITGKFKTTCIVRSTEENESIKEYVENSFMESMQEKSIYPEELKIEIVRGVKKEEE